MSLLRRVMLVVIIELFLVGFVGGFLSLAFLGSISVIGHDELPFYKQNPELVGPLVARELASIAPMEIDALCGGGYSALLVDGWRHSGLPRIDRIRRNLSDKRILVRAFFENSRGYERRFYRDLLCHAQVFDRWSPGDPRLRLLYPTVPSSDKSLTD